MDVALFGKILEKLQAELLGRYSDVFLALYSWGEPLIHPKIGQLVSMSRQAGFRVGLSSNLNFTRNLESAIAAGPDEFVVSLSGFFQDNYKQSHTNGDIEDVKVNLRTLSDLITRHGYRTKVFLHYHCYTHNSGDDIVFMAQLCEELRFTFIPGIAYYMPVENMLKATRGDLPEADSDIVEKLLVPISDQLKIASAHAKDSTTCELVENRIDIDVDGAVKLCCSSFDRANNVAHDYLSSSFTEIQSRRAKALLCGPCMDQGIYRVYTLKDYSTWRQLANERLADIDSPLRFTDTGERIEGVEGEIPLLSAAVRLMNDGNLDDARSTKCRLDALIERKYGAAATTISGIMMRLRDGQKLLGARLPQNPLLYFFIEAALLRNLEGRPEESRLLLQELQVLADILTDNVEYRPHIEALRPIIDDWFSLPV
nr:hypothetical protein [Methylocaldum sp. 14B]